MSGESPSQPGWYPDQNGAMRWFDGTAWTDHIQPGTGEIGLGAGATQVYSSPPNPTAQFPAQGGEPAGWQGAQQSGPPPGAPPGSAYGAVPQPSFPGGPGGPGGPPGFQPPSGGSNRGLLILLAVVGAVVLIAVLAVGSWAVFVRDSDGGGDSAKNRGGNDSSLPDTEPEDVAEQFMEGVLANDCDVIEGLVTDKLLEEEGGCQVEDMPGDFTYEVLPAAVDEDAKTATVPVELTSGAENGALTLGMIIQGDEWKIDQLVESEDATDGPTDTPTIYPTDPPTDLPTDLPTDFTDFPTDFTDLPTDFPTDPSEIESYLSDYFSDFSDFFTYTP